MLKSFYYSFLTNHQLAFTSVRPICRTAIGNKVSCFRFCTKPVDESLPNVNERTFKKMRGTGDKGQSGLFTGERRWKDDKIFEALGTIDELSSSIGVVRYMFEKQGLFDVASILTEIQCCLQDMGAHVATPASSARDAHLKRTTFDASLADRVDSLIDEYSKLLPPLTHFILPGGNDVASFTHVARSLCRKTERRVTSLIREEKVDAQTQRYLNRLSDLLFVLARYACQTSNTLEISYKKPRYRSSGKPVDDTD